MAKEPKWSQKELEILKTEKANGKTYRQIHKILKEKGYERSFHGVKTKGREVVVRVEKRGGTVPKRKPGVIQTFVASIFNIGSDVCKVAAFYDCHCPENIDMKPAVDFLKHLHYADELIIGGDFWDLDMVSHHNSQEFDKWGFDWIREELKRQADRVRGDLGWLRDSFPRAKLTYIIGNHEDRLPRYCEKFAQLGEIHIEDLLEFKNMHIQMVPLNGFYRVGKIAFCHGNQFGSQYPCRQAVDRCHSTVVMGHFHKFMVHPGFSMVDDRTEYLGIAVPCMTGRAPEWLRGRCNDWQNGFFTACVKKGTGNFTQHIILTSPKGHFISEDGREWT